MLLKTMMPYQLQNEDYIRVLYIFLAGHFQHWPILLFFAQDILSLKVYNKIVKKFVHRMLRSCLPYFSQNPQIRNWCIKGWEFCSLLSTCFSISLFLFCLPDMCACAIFWENQNKYKPSVCKQGTMHLLKRQS